jgi:hypothetical protein
MKNKEYLSELGLITLLWSLIINKEHELRSLETGCRDENMDQQRGHNMKMEEIIQWSFMIFNECYQNGQINFFYKIFSGDKLR